MPDMDQMPSFARGDAQDAAPVDPAATAPPAAAATPAAGSRPAAAAAPQRSRFPYRLLHVSDLHLGRTFDPSLWEYVEAFVRREQPHLIVCTGDLVDHGELFMLALARRQLDKLRAEVSGAPALLRVVPGNHDCGPWGNFQLPLFRKNFQAIFGEAPLPLPEGLPDYLAYRAAWLPRRLWMRLKFGWLLYRARVQAWRGGVRRRGLPIVRAEDADAIHEALLVYLDSNAGMRLASGCVHVGELMRLQAKALCLRDDEPSHKVFVPRIALVHHHPVPIPHANIREGLTSFEPFLVLRNAGTVLRELSRCDVDLVLHGHKHFSSFTRLGYSLDQDVEGEIAVLAAGSAGVTLDESGRNSMNMVEIFEGGRMAFTTIAFGGGRGLPVTELYRNRQQIHGLEMHKRRLFRRGLERHGQHCALLFRRVSTDTRGTARVAQGVQAFRVERALADSRRDIRLSVSLGGIDPRAVKLDAASQRSGYGLHHAPDAPCQDLTCTVDLRRDLSTATEPLDYGVEYVAFNTLALTRWEIEQAMARDRKAGPGPACDANPEREPTRSHDPQRKSTRAPGIDWIGQVVRFPSRQLVLTVQIPVRYVGRPMVRVMRWSKYPHLSLDRNRQFVDRDDGEWLYDSDQSIHEKDGLTLGENERWTLCVNFPIVGYRYDIVWQLDDSGMPVDPLAAAFARGIRARRLHEAATRPPSTAGLQNVTDGLFQTFRSKTALSERFGVGVFIYDDRTQELVLTRHAVAVDRPRTDGQPAADAGALRIPLGEGVAGATFKRRALTAYVSPDIPGGADDGAYVFYPRGERADERTDWQVIVALPIFVGMPGSDLRSVLDPVGSPHETVGVLSVASTAPDSQLLRLIESLRQAPLDAAGGDGEDGAPARATLAAQSAAGSAGVSPQRTQDGAQEGTELAASLWALWFIVHGLVQQTAPESA